MAKNSRADESTLHNATPKGGSLRTTVPAFIVSQFELKKGNKLRWFIIENGLAGVEVVQDNNKDNTDVKKG